MTPIDIYVISLHTVIILVAIFYAFYILYDYLYNYLYKKIERQIFRPAQIITQTVYTSPLHLKMSTFIPHNKLNYARFPIKDQRIKNLKDQFANNIRDYIELEEHEDVHGLLITGKLTLQIKENT